MAPPTSRSLERPSRLKTASRDSMALDSASSSSDAVGAAAAFTVMVTSSTTEYYKKLQVVAAVIVKNLTSLGRAGVRSATAA